MSLSVVDAEGDEVFSLYSSAVLVVDPDILSFKAQLEELTLRDGNLHLSMLTGHLRLENVIITCQTHRQISCTWQGQTSIIIAGKCDAVNILA